jgi:hypothetical protein
VVRQLTEYALAWGAWRRDELSPADYLEAHHSLLTNLALDLADHGYVMENGRIVLEGPAAQLRQNADIQEFYLGLGETGARRAYKDVKHYRRRKRWLS